jgi:DNA topoisomerase-1
VTNASLRKGDDVLSITDERAAEYWPTAARSREADPKKAAAKKVTRKAAKKAGFAESTVLTHFRCSSETVLVV